MTSVMIADDQALVRMGLRVLIQREPDLELVGEAENGVDALALIRRIDPDVALVDIRMPRLDGLQVLQSLAESRTRVVMLTTFESDDYVFTALRSGASGFVLKDAEPGELIRALRVAARGEALLSPSVTRRVIRRFEAPGRGLEFERLTEREREIVGWVGTGRSNEEIAAELSLSPATVRTHVGRAMVKLGARDRTQLAVSALRSGLSR